MLDQPLNHCLPAGNEGPWPHGSPSEGGYSRAFAFAGASILLIPFLERAPELAVIVIGIIVIFMSVGAWSGRRCPR